MISVGRDARKELGLGCARREMEDAELEEGEACSYQNNEDFDSNIDPDVALSYIDVKIQHVLGHFQKDFEGGVSAENLGSKFGGYGSFLPSYQRSPVLSQSRTPQKGHNCSTSRSPNNFQQEVGPINSVVSSTTPQSIKPGPPSTSSTSLPIIKGPNLNESSKQEVCTSFQHIEELASGYGCGNNKSTTSSDQISLKVLIKVGSDNLPTRKNDAIYSGLGLDVSPSSSLDDSPPESEGISCELQDGPFESPTSILQTMTSFPVHGGLLLSPLHDDLIHLTQMGKPGRDIKSTRVQQYKQDDLLAGGASLQGGQMLVEKKMSKDTNGFLCESKNTNSKGLGFLNGSITTSKKMSEIDAKSCEELVSDALKLPLLSNSYTMPGESTKGMNRPSETLVDANKVVTRDKHFFDRPEECLAVELPLTVEDVKQTNGSSGKVREPKKLSKFDDISIFAKKSGESKREKTIDSIEAASMGNNASNGDQIEPLKPNTNHKTAPHAHGNLKHTSGKDNLFTEGKKKSKFSQTDCIHNGEVSKHSVKSGSSGSKTKSINKVDNISTRTEIEDHKPQDSRKTKVRYRDFFGELEEDDNLIDASEIPFEDQLNHSHVFEKPTAVIPASKETISVEKISKSLASKAFPKVVKNPASGTVTDVAPAAVDNVTPQDNWVCCDRCQQWRLLPLGTNPSSLPEKWVCSMLDWLPGMNLCDFTEEETTKALIARLQAPAAPEGNIYSNLSGVMPGVANARPSGHNHRHYDFNALPGGGKKKPGAKEKPSMTLKGDAPQLSNSKKHAGAVKNRSLEDVNRLPIVDEANFHHLNKSGDVPDEKHKLKYKEKREFDNLSEEGTTKSSKPKFRKEKEQDYSRPSKKVKTDGLYLTDEDQMSGHSGPVVKVGPTLSIVFPSVSGGTSKSKNTDHSSKDSKYNANVIHQVPNDKRENKLLGATDDDSLEGGNSSTKRNSKKREVKASLGIQTNIGSLSGSGHLPQKRGPVTEFSDNDHRRKEKKTKLSKPPGKESSGRKEKKGSHSKNWLHEQDVGSTLSHRSLDGADSLKGDFGAIQSSLVATSSSSKISGSHKTKSSFQDIKGSPVESVSSLPMRIPNRDKILRSSRDGKDFLDGGRTRCSDGEEEDDGSDRSGTGSKKNYSVAHHRPLKSPLFDTVNDGASNISGNKAKAKEKSSSDLPNCDLPNDILGNSVIDHQHSSKPWAEQVQNEDRRANEMRYRGNETYPVKSGNDLSSLSKDKSGSSCLDVGIGKDRVPYSHDNLQGGSPPHSDLKVKNNGKHKLPNNSRIKSGDAREDGSGKLSIERDKIESELNIVKHEGPDSSVDRNSKENVVFSAGKNQQDDCNGTALFQKNDLLEKGTGKSMVAQLPTSGELRNQMLHGPPSAGGGKEKASDILQVNASKSNDVSKGKKHVKNRHKEAQTNGSRHSTPNERVPIDAPSPARRDSSNQAATKAMKEAKDLKHLADRFKNTGSNHDFIGLYFQAALKFLYGASLLESSNNETAKQSMQIYSSTAKLCEFCAHEYEKIKDMAAAALAYKCMEVAYMRVIYSSHNSAIRDRNDLQQIALKMGPSGESSSSASDIDNVNNPAAADKVDQSKGVGLSQATGSHVIPAKSHPNFLRLLSYAQDINFAMEASRKSRIAFAAANLSSAGTTIKEGISCIKTALDFNFQDVEGLLALVRIAMEAINS